MLKRLLKVSNSYSIWVTKRFGLGFSPVNLELLQFALSSMNQWLFLLCQISTNVERDQISVKMEHVETSRELISVTVTQDMCEVRMERNVKVNISILRYSLSFVTNVKTSISFNPPITEREIQGIHNQCNMIFFRAFQPW